MQRESKMNNGSCLCGDIRWKIDGDVTMHSNCHCSICRKVHGSAYATFVFAPASAFSWTSGEDRIAFYQSSEMARRGFCPVSHALGFCAIVNGEFSRSM